MRMRKVATGLPFFFLPPSALPLAAALRVVVFSLGILAVREWNACDSDVADARSVGLLRLSQCDRDGSG